MCAALEQHRKRLLLSSCMAALLRALQSELRRVQAGQGPSNSPLAKGAAATHL